MRIKVTVKPNSKKSGIEKIGKEYVASVKALSVEGRANSEPIEILRLLPSYEIEDKDFFWAKIKEKIGEID